MFLLEAPRANPSVSPACGEEWPMTAAIWPLSIFAWLTDYGPAGLFGRTSPVSCRRLADGTLVPLSGGWQNSGMGGPTERLTLSIFDWPSDGSVCSLSDILETGDVPRRFYLSPRACVGILRRAEKRGKQLPEALRRALEAAAVSEPTSIAMED